MKSVKAATYTGSPEKFHGGGSSNDCISRFSFPSIIEEFMKDGGLDVVVGSEDGNGLISGAEDLMDEMCDSGFASGAGNTDETKIAGGMTIIGR